MKLTGINHQPFIRETTGAAGLPAGSSPAVDLPPGAGSGSAAATVISKPAEMFNKLRQLREKDPAAFTEVVSTLTEKLKTAAAQHDADLTGPLLSDLASKFEEVANGGDLTALQAASPSGATPFSGAAPWQPAADLLGQRPGLDDVFSSISAALDQALK